MRILFAIPHYFASGAGAHGSLAGDRQRRLACLAACVGRLHETFGGWQRMTHSGHPHGGLPANEAFRHDIDVVVCTAGGAHLLDGLPAGLCRHHATHAEPPLLGYEAHAVLRDGLGRYDWFCFLEDDLLLGDPMMFAKLAWFLELAGEDCVLLPNRYERAPGRKLYIDGSMRRDAAAGLQDRTQRPCLTGRLMGLELSFVRPRNPHSGCFFLTAAQMRRWAGSPHFLDRAADFWGPLESAATLGVLRSFAVYKPARGNAGFLEVTHADNRHLRPS